MTASFGSTHDATVKNWTDQTFTEYLTGNTVSFLMGSTADSPVHVMEPGDGMTGDTWKYFLIGKVTGGIYGDGQLAGNEQPLNIFKDEVTVRTIRNAHRIDDWYISSDNTRVDLMNSARSNLTNWGNEILKCDILYALTGTIIDSTYQTTGNGFSTTARATGRTQYRALYGNSTANYNATEATAFGNITAANDKFSVDTLRLAREMSQNKAANSKMRPITVDLVKGVPSEGYIALIGNRQARDLENDTRWVNQRLYKIQKDTQTLFNGAYYRGSIQGVDVFVIPEMPVITGVGASSIDVAQGVLLGAQAATQVWRMRPTFAARKEDDYGNTMGMALTMIRGEKRNTFTQNAIAENWGVISFFSAAVAG